MADRVYVNGRDISEHIRQIVIEGGEALIKDAMHAMDQMQSALEQSGLVKTGEFTISGYWDDGKETCSVCQQRFTPGPEGTAVLTDRASGQNFGPVCPACGTSLVRPTE